MMIARWHFEAKFGHKQEAIALGKEWDEQIGKQTDLDIEGSRTVTGYRRREGIRRASRLSSPGLVRASGVFRQDCTSWHTPATSARQC